MIQIKRGALFVTGAIVFVAGILVPFLINLVIGLTVKAEGSRTFGFSVGFFASVFIGVPLILLGIFWKRKGNGEE